MKVYLYETFHRCESITDWTPGNCVLVIDSTQKVEGKYSIKMTTDDGAASFMSYDKTVDWSEFKDIIFSVYHPGWTNETGFIGLYTDWGNYKQWEFNFAASWAERIIDLSSTPSEEVGVLDLANITFIIFFPDDITTPGEDYYFDFIHGRSIDITSDVVNGLSFIETPIRDFHRVEFMAKGTWEIKKDYTIEILDYYTSNGSTTAEQIIFEGTVVDYELTFIRKIWCHSRAKRDLDEFRPSGDYNGDLDSNHIKTLIAECSYITEGTIDATMGNTDNTFKGDKTFRTILNDWADKHYKHWYLSPTGALMFNDADVDSGENFDQDSRIWNVKPKKHVDAINWVMLLGGILAGAQISAESKDQASINQLGAKIYKDTYAIITVVAQLQIAADNLRTREQLLPLSINYWYHRINKGLIQVGETVTFEHDKMNPIITSRQIILNKVVYRFLSGHVNLQTSDGISFTKNRDESLPQENSELIQQIAPGIYTDADADARIALANHDTLLNPNGNAEEQHMTSAQVTALHPQLTNLNQLATRSHPDLQNIGANEHHVAFVQANADALYSVLAHLHDDRYMTDAEIAAAIAATYTDAEINALLLALDYLTEAEVATAIDTDIATHEGNPGDINHLTDVQVGALHTRKHTMISSNDHQGGTWKIYFTNQVGAVVELAIGADTKILKSNGPDQVPSWEPDETGGAGGDTDAIHINVDGEIDDLVGVTPTVLDKIIIEDQSDSWSKKECALGDFAYSKAEVDAKTAVGAIIMFSGAFTNNVTMVGWYKCDGTNGTPNLVDKFIRGAATSGGSGGSDNAIVVSHAHNIGMYTFASLGSGDVGRINPYGADTSNIVRSTGVSGTNANIPAYYALIFIMRVS